MTETVRVKSGAWDTNDRVFVYTTLNHVKYCLPNGDTGIVRTLDVPIYITKFHQKQLHCLDRECKTRVISIDISEALFKLALEDQNYHEVMRMVKHSNLCGKAIIFYLQSKGFPEVALHFVEDLTTRFKLALACGNIEIAMNTAYEIGDNKCWHRLGLEALRQGNHQVVEMSYQRTKNFERLSFLYLLTGNTDKLRKMLKIAEMRKDPMGRFHNALYLGDAGERVRILEQCGQLLLAYITASAHGLDEAETLSQQLQQLGVQPPELQANSYLIQPPTPIIRAENWPLLSMPKNTEYTVSTDGDSSDLVDQPSDSNAWGELDLEADEAPASIDADAATGDDGWGEDLDLGEDVSMAGGHDVKTRSRRMGDSFVVPLPGTGPEAYWCSHSSHAADHAAAGSFESSMQLLNRQIAISRFSSLKPRFIQIVNAVNCAVPGLPLSASLSMPLKRDAQDNSAGLLPHIAISTPRLIEVLKLAYRSFQKGNFIAAKDSFDKILTSLPFTVAESRSASNEVCDCTHN